MLHGQWPGRGGSVRLHGSRQLPTAQLAVCKRCPGRLCRYDLGLLLDIYDTVFS